MSFKKLINFDRIWQKISFLIMLAIIVILTVSAFIEWRQDIGLMEESISNKMSSLIAMSEIAISSPIWDYDSEAVNAYGNSLFKDKEIAFVSVEDNVTGELFKRERKEEMYLEQYILREKVEITYSNTTIGTLEIGISKYFGLREINQRFRRRAIELLISTAVLLLIIIYISTSITRPLSTLSQSARQIADGNYEIQVEAVSNDEVGQLTMQFNQMARSILEAKEELSQLNEELEERVENRTSELTEKNEALNRALTKLEETRDELIRTAKMTLTSQLVAGVSHEINTPLGVSITACSYLMDSVNEISDLYRSQNLSKKRFEDKVHDIQASTKTIERNLSRSANLVNSFKELALDQFTQDKRQFNLNDYLQNVLLSFKGELDHKKHSVDLQCPKDLVLQSYPSAYLQIFTNLLSNSIVHGFEKMDGGHISIDIRKDLNTLTLIYKDDGQGIPPESIELIFDPFYSVKHNTERIGIGLSIVRNVVENTLGGSVQCKSSIGEGTVFYMFIPENG